MLKQFDFTTRLTALGILIFVLAQFYFGFSELAITLLYGYTLREIPGLIHITTTHNRNMIGKQL